jgi:hypothetical protein
LEDMGLLKGPVTSQISKVRAYVNKLCRDWDMSNSTTQKLTVR